MDKLDDDRIEEDDDDRVAARDRGVIEMFYLYRCPFVYAIMKKSRVDIHTSSLAHYMRGIGKFIRNNEIIKRQLQ